MNRILRLGFVAGLLASLVVGLSSSLGQTTVTVPTVPAASAAAAAAVPAPPVPTIFDYLGVPQILKGTWKIGKGAVNLVRRMSPLGDPPPPAGAADGAAPGGGDAPESPGAKAVAQDKGGEESGKGRRAGARVPIDSWMWRLQSRCRTRILQWFRQLLP